MPMTPDEALVCNGCVTHGHEASIADAIERSLKQQSPFPVEILIPGDAPTVRTAGIVRELGQMLNGWSQAKYLAMALLAKARRCNSGISHGTPM